MKRLRNSVVKWLVVSLICLLLGFLLGKFKQDLLEQNLAVLSADLQTTNTRNELLETQVSGFDVITTSNQQTITSLLQSNKQLQDELDIVNNKLYFYEGVIAPENDATGVKVHSFEISQNALTENWDYELVLMQSQKGRRFLNGKYDIFLSVFEGQDIKQVALSEYTEQADNAFKFKYFQTIQGSFSLPAEMTVDEVVVKLNVAGNRWYKAQNIEARYDWRVLTTKDVGDSSEFDSSENEIQE